MCPFQQVILLGEYQGLQII